MNKRIDFSFNGGFPATQYMVDYMQQSYRAAFMAMAGLAGDKVIITGCQIVGNQITNGWISVNGELVPFIGGAGNLNSPITIVETNETRLFQDNNSHIVYYTRQARISAPGTFLFGDLKNIGTLKSILPQGLISMWSGAIENIPTGWALCDGSGGTPDLRGRFIVGYSADNPDYSLIGNTGGEAKHTLTIAEMPAHTHTQTGINAANSGTSGIGANNGTSNTGSTGGDQPHENRPPYYTLAYIIKL